MKWALCVVLCADTMQILFHNEPFQIVSSYCKQYKYTKFITLSDLIITSYSITF